MKKISIILFFLPFLFAGTTGQNTLPEDTSNTMDTMMVKRIAQRMAYEWAAKKSVMLDSVFAKTITIRVDYETRPNGSIYAWIWKYRVAGRDTTFDRVITKKIR